MNYGSSLVPHGLFDTLNNILIELNASSVNVPEDIDKIHELLKLKYLEVKRLEKVFDYHDFQVWDS
jgi:Trm5-related predicted tRNA methylase